mgnify:CR=1 FL=1
MARKSQAEIELAADTSGLDWITMKEAALRFGVCERTIRRWIADGYIRARRFGPRLIRVDANSIVEGSESVIWMAS